MQKEELVSEILLQDLNSRCRTNKDIESQHTAQYLQHLGFQSIEQYQAQRQAYFSNLKNFYTVEPNHQFNEKPYFQITSHLPNYEFITLSVTLGHFLIKNIVIANFDTQSPTHKSNHHFSGNFCTTYKANYDGNIYAFKCFELPSRCQANKQSVEILKKKRITILREVIIEYCFVVITSYLKIGPKICLDLSYKIAVYRNCIEFPMEFCLTGDRIPESVDFEKESKEALKKAHFVKLFHFDVKPDNICFSPWEKKIVFIDFGFSEFIDIELGQRREMAFKGSVFYCSKELVQVFNTGVAALVDPYYNDLHCLLKCLEQKQVSNQNKAANKLFLHSKNRQTALQLMLLDLTADLIVKNFKCSLYVDLFFHVLDFLNNNKCLKLLTQQRAQIVDFIDNFFDIYFYSEIKRKIIDKSQMYEEAAPSKFLKLEFPTSKCQKLPQNCHAQQFDSYRKVFNSLTKITAFKENCKRWLQNFKSQKDLLLKTSEINRMALKSYFIILAEAIRLNTNKYSFQERKEFALEAFSLLTGKCKHNQANNEFQRFALAQNINDELFYLKRVSKWLLDYSLTQPFSRAKQKIYESIMLNVIILRAASPQQIFQYFKKIHGLAVRLQVRLRVIIVFMFSFEWMLYTIKSQANYFDHLEKYRNFSSGFVVQLRKAGFSESIIEIYRNMSTIYRFGNTINLTDQLEEDFNKSQNYLLSNQFGDIILTLMLKKLFDYQRLKFTKTYPERYRQFQCATYKLKFHDFQEFEVDKFAIIRNYFGRQDIFIYPILQQFFKILGGTTLQYQFNFHSIKTYLDYLSKANISHSSQHLLEGLSSLVPESQKQRLIISNIWLNKAYERKYESFYIQMFYKLKLNKYCDTFQDYGDFLKKVSKNYSIFLFDYDVLSSVKKLKLFNNPKIDWSLQAQQKKEVYFKQKAYFKSTKAKWSAQQQVHAFIHLLIQLSLTLQISSNQVQKSIKLLDIVSRLIYIVRGKLIKGSFLAFYLCHFVNFEQYKFYNSPSVKVNSVLAFNIAKEYKLLQCYTKNFELSECWLRFLYYHSSMQLGLKLLTQYLIVFAQQLNSNMQIGNDDDGRIVEILYKLLCADKKSVRYTKLMEMIQKRISTYPSLSIFIKCYFIIEKDLAKRILIKFLKALKFLKPKLKQLTMYNFYLAYVAYDQKVMPVRRRFFLLKKNVRFNHPFRMPGTNVMRSLQLGYWLNPYCLTNISLPKRNKFTEIFREFVGKIKVQFYIRTTSNPYMDAYDKI